MEDTNKLQSFYRGALNPFMIDIKNEKEIINELMLSFQRLDKLWEMAISHEVRQNAINRIDSQSGETSEVTVKYPEASHSISSNLLQSATNTGSTSTIQPSISSSAQDISTDSNNNDVNSDNDDTLRSVVYVEECDTLNFIEENYLNTEDYDFIDSIRSSNFSGILLPPVVCDFIEFPMPTSANPDDIMSVSCAITTFSQKSSYISLYVDATNTFVMENINFNIRFFVYIFNHCIILVWDPGIFSL
jgi:hypothetical protein